jgi:hypothetical protein
MSTARCVQRHRLEEPVSGFAHRGDTQSSAAIWPGVRWHAGGSRRGGSGRSRTVRARGAARTTLRTARRSGARHNQRPRAWRVGHLIRVLSDKAEAARITVRLVDERSTSSTCPACARRVPKPAGRVFACPHCGQAGHRNLVAAANIAARTGAGTIPVPAAAGITHRRAGAHLPGVHPARRDPRRRLSSRPVAGLLAGTGPPRMAPTVRGVAHPQRGTRKPTPTN